MSRNEFLSGKRTAERQAIAEALLWARGMDHQLGHYQNDADILQYFIKLQGLTHFMDYLKSLGENGLVLDIGAGTTKAVSQLEKSSLGNGLSFRATVLSRNREIERNLGYDKVIQTEVETLRGVGDLSVVGVISRSGIDYSAVPAIAVASIDRVLMPGGAIKTCFSYDSEPDEILKDYNKTHGRFSEALLNLGYDVAISPTFSAIALLAIKPGGSLGIGADKLMALDNGSRDYLAMVHGEI
jgi:SAM-dependent methyltransferase